MFRDFALGDDRRSLPELHILEAYAQYGRGRHPASLNMGDCFAYACARTNRAKLLFKGEDFPKTDIAPAGSSMGEDETGN